MNDFYKFGKKVRIGGSVFFDDCNDEGCFIKVEKSDNCYPNYRKNNFIW